MKFTPAHRYAVSALLYLADQSHGTPVAATELCKECHLPRPYLGQVLGKLARAGLLVSTKGATGGYTLAIKPAKISLLHIIEAVDDVFGDQGDVDVRALDADSVELIEKTLADVSSNARSRLAAITLSSLQSVK